jgi:adenosylmethionine-8-amino-7-oxononanoate aminotransferase
MQNENSATDHTKIDKDITSNSELMNLDLEYIWHPCTQMKDHETLPLIPIKNGRGVWLYDFEGNRYLDAISSWWVNLFGHANQKISQAITKQSKELEHVLLAGFTHRPAIELAKKLVEISPKALKKVFFADNGSSAIEVALKMSFHYHKNMGEKRELFLSLTNSYHGETLGALSVGDVWLYKETYKPLLIKNIQTPVPKNQTKEATDEAIQALEAILKKHGKDISAFIVEPLIQGAGGMHIYSSQYLKRAYNLIKTYGIHLIADEIMTGFGRSGTMFASEQAGISPDFMTLSKGITGGFLPLSVVLTTDEIYQAFYCDYEKYKAFLHSHSYTGNPLACSASLATLDIFESEDILKKNRDKSIQILEGLKRFEKLERVKNIRGLGMVFAFDIDGYSPKKRIGLEVYKFGLKNQVLLRPLGNTIYFMPPYIINSDEIELMLGVAFDAIKALKS